MQLIMSRQVVYVDVIDIRFNLLNQYCSMFISIIYIVVSCSRLYLIQ